MKGDTKETISGQMVSNIERNKICKILLLKRVMFDHSCTYSFYIPHFVIYLESENYITMLD